MSRTSMLTDDQARDAALATADRLFYERGIRPVRMEDVRDGSGVSLKRLYKLFPNKDQLAAETLRRRELDFIGALRSYVESRRAPSDRVLAIFDFLDSWFREPDFRGCAFINSFGEMASSSQCVLAATQSQKRCLRELVRELVHAAGGTPALADQITMLIHGATVSAAMLEDSGAAREAQSAARALLESAGVIAAEPS